MGRARFEQLNLQRRDPWRFLPGNLRELIQHPADKKKISIRTTCPLLRTHHEDRVASKNSLSNEVPKMVGCVSRKMQHLARNVTELKLLPVFEQHVKIICHVCVTEAIDWGKMFLHLFNAFSDADEWFSRKVLLVKLRRSQMVGMGMGLTT